MGETDSEKGQSNDKDKQQVQERSGMSQSSKDDLWVCVVIILITVLAIIVTVIKIILFDIHQYPALFGLEEDDPNASSTTTTTNGPL